MAPITKSSLVVIDSWPVMEWFLERDPGASYFQAVLEQAMRKERRLVMSVVNVGEVFYSIAKRMNISAAERVIDTLGRLNIETASVDDELVWQGARLKAAHPVAYGDAFAAALAMRLSAPLLTGDPEFHSLQAAGLIEVEWAWVV